MKVEDTKRATTYEKRKQSTRKIKNYCGNVHTEWGSQFHKTDINGHKKRDSFLYNNVDDLNILLLPTDRSFRIKHNN